MQVSKECFHCGLCVVYVDIQQIVIRVVVDLNQKCGTFNVTVADIPLHRADGDRHYI